MSVEDFDQHDFDVSGELTPVAEPPISAEVWLQDTGATGLEPAGFDLATWDCVGPVEQAVVIWPDFAPGEGELPPTPVGWTSPAGDVALLEGVDLNGDGIVDLVALDANGDGAVDTWLMDTTGIPSGATGAFFADAMFVDTSGDGLPNCVCRDVDGTGTLPTYRSTPRRAARPRARAGPSGGRGAFPGARDACTGRAGHSVDRRPLDRRDEQDGRSGDARRHPPDDRDPQPSRRRLALRKLNMDDFIETPDVFAVGGAPSPLDPATASLSEILINDASIQGPDAASAAWLEPGTAIADACCAPAVPAATTLALPLLDGTVVQLPAEDLDGSGRPERVSLDLNQDGIADAWGYDQAGTGQVDILLFDADGDGLADAVSHLTPAGWTQVEPIDVARAAPAPASTTAPAPVTRRPSPRARAGHDPRTGGHDRRRSPPPRRSTPTATAAPTPSTPGRSIATTAARATATTTERRTPSTTSRRAPSRPGPATATTTGPRTPSTTSRRAPSRPRRATATTTATPTTSTANRATPTKAIDRWSPSTASRTSRTPWRPRTPRTPAVADPAPAGDWSGLRRPSARPEDAWWFEQSADGLCMPASCAMIFNQHTGQVIPEAEFVALAQQAGLLTWDGTEWSGMTVEQGAAMLDLLGLEGARGGGRDDRRPRPLGGRGGPQRDPRRRLRRDPVRRRRRDRRQRRAQTTRCGWPRWTPSAVSPTSRTLASPGAAATRSRWRRSRTRSPTRAARSS